MRFIAHRGAWWSRRELQNSPSSITSAFAQGWGVEIDVQSLLVDGLSVGHDLPEYDVLLNAQQLEREDQPLILHMKFPREGNMPRIERLCRLLQRTRQYDTTYLFWSPDHVGPDPDLAAIGIKQLLPVDCEDALSTALANPLALAHINGFWLEQPDDDWVTETTIGSIHNLGKTAWVLSPELHQRTIDLASIKEWETADGICTDVPQLLSRILDETDTIVHPSNPWWQ